MRPVFFIFVLLFAFTAAAGAQTNVPPAATAATSETKQFDDQITALQVKILKVKADSHQQPELRKQIPALYAELTELRKKRRAAQIEIQRGLAPGKKSHEADFRSSSVRKRAAH